MQYQYLIHQQNYIHLWHKNHKHKLGENLLLAMKFGELEAPADQTVFISHGDCEADARQVKQHLVDMYGCDPEKVVLSFVGPVIGSHAGPGTVALFFRGKDRG